VHLNLNFSGPNKDMEPASLADLWLFDLSRTNPMSHDLVSRSELTRTVNFLNYSFRGRLELLLHSNCGSLELQLPGPTPTRTPPELWISWTTASGADSNSYSTRTMDLVNYSFRGRLGLVLHSNCGSLALYLPGPTRTRTPFELWVLWTIASGADSNSYSTRTVGPLNYSFRCRLELVLHSNCGSSEL
jgi:hypothetical protein